MPDPQLTWCSKLRILLNDPEACEDAKVYLEYALYVCCPDDEISGGGPRNPPPPPGG